MFIAKMHTRYPEFHGTGYYNFIIKATEEALHEAIEQNSHDFMLVGTVKTRHKSTDAIVEKYPTKQDLNSKFFERS